jgi:transposase
VRVLGVDDFAFRKGQRYGTILVDLERRRVVDLLPDREAATLSGWLAGHPEVEVVSRDRAAAYAEGARLGAPQAVQVADRFHLLQNLTQAFERLLQRYHKALRDTSRPRVVITENRRPPKGAGRLSPSQQRLLEGQAACRERRRQRYDLVRDLHSQGVSMRHIARQTGLARNTVKAFLRMEDYPQPVRSKHRLTSLTPYQAYLKERLEQGIYNAAQLWREIRERGFRGSVDVVQRWAASLPAEQRRLKGSAVKLAPPSPRQALWWLLKDEENPRPEIKDYLERLLSQAPEIRQAQQLAHDFRRIVRGRKAAELDEWISEVRRSGLTELANFAEGLAGDEAVRAALSSEWSNGQVEGQVGRLKTLKRQMYGRATFSLLRLRMLSAL